MFQILFWGLISLWMAFGKRTKDTLFIECEDSTKTTLIFEEHVRQVWLLSKIGENHQEDRYSILEINSELGEDEGFIENKYGNVFDTRNFFACKVQNWYYHKNASLKECSKCPNHVLGNDSESRSLAATSGDQDKPYLQRSVKPDHETLVSILLAITIVISLIMCYISGTPAVFLQLLLAQCQTIRAISLFNIEMPNKYVKFSKNFSLSSFTFSFLDFFTLQDEMKEAFDGRTGEFHLNNLGFKTGSLIIHYIYFYLILALLVMLHALFKPVVAWLNPKEDSVLDKICQGFKKVFEYSIFINLIVNTAMMTFILSFNEILNPALNSDFKRFSFAFSIFWFSWLLIMTCIPVILFFIKTGEDSIEGENEHYVVKLPYKVIERLKQNMSLGLKKNKMSKLYTTMFLARRALLALTLIFFTNSILQLILYMWANLGYMVYLCVYRPFKHKIHNVIAIINEFVLLLVGALMFAYLDDNEPADAIWIFIIVLFIVNLIVCWYITGSIYEGYQVYKTIKSKRETTSQRLKSTLTISMRAKGIAKV